jgi:HK97 family phage major capsid protein
MAGLGRFDLTIEELIATTTTIDSGVYETVKAEFDTKKLDFRRIAEGSPFPTVTITSGKNSIRLAKIGLAMDATYEVLRRMKLPLMAIHMQLIGKRLAKRMVAYAMYNVISGDGNDNAAPQADPASISYDNLLDFFLDMDAWEATLWTAKTATLKKILKLDEFKDSRLFDTAATGNLARIFGYQVRRFNWTETTLGDGMVIQLDKSAALELVKENGAELVETDKVIDRQLEKTVISQVVGFSRIFADAAKVFVEAEEEPEG